jgi:hypothetical protein
LSQKDWIEVKEKFENKQSNFFEKFLNSNEFFYPSNNFKNIFNEKNNLIYAKDLKKEKPGNWIPIYNKKDLPEFFVKNKIYPIRSGQAAFFFYKGEVFLELKKIKFREISKKDIEPIANFIPESLKVKFQRNENAYLNKAIALGIINHFIDIYESLHILKTEITTKKYSRLLYGQFGKIKLTNKLKFQTSKGYKTIEPGFQFEIDLVLENNKEIFIIEAKCGTSERDNFSLLQLYYPYIYFKSIIKNKIIRTFFIDIVETDNEEYYKLLEIKFENNFFDKVRLIKSCKYI